MTLVEARPRRLRAPAPTLPGLELGAGTAAVVVLAVVAAVHAVVVAPHYHVGSFDDDAHYLALAHAVEHGKGYVDASLPGAPTEALYPPGYPAVLVPLFWLFGGAIWPVRVLSALAFVICVPMMDLLLRRHFVPAVPRLFAVALFALSPVAATFATMVMPETLFLVVLLGVLLALPRWEQQDSILTRAGAVVMLGTPTLLLFKSAAVPMVAAVIGWLAIRRHFRHAGAVLVSSGVLLAPALVARLSGGSVVGDRYAQEYTRNQSLIHSVIWGAHHYVTDAIPASILQWFSLNLVHHGPLVHGALYLVRYSAALIVALGWIAWLRVRRDVTLLIVPLYLAETLPFPYINERRVILVLPLVLAWYAVGWLTVGRFVSRWLPARPAAALAAYAAVPGLLVLPALAAQFPRNYLLSIHEQSSRPIGSGYAAAVRAVTPPGWSVATSYRWTMSWATGRTATNDAFLAAPCPSTVDGRFLSATHTQMSGEHVASVLVATLNRPEWLDSPCLLAGLSEVPWAVPVYSGADRSTVFVLLGAATPRAGERVAASFPARDAVEVFAQARVATGDAHLSLQVRTGSTWTTVATAAVGPSPVLLHARLETPQTIDGVRVVGAPAVTVQHVVVLHGR